MTVLKHLMKCHAGSLVVAGMLMAVAAGSASAADITISCGSIGQDFEMCKKMTDEWSAKTGNKVTLFTAPNSSTDILALFRQQFGAKSSEIDVVMVDVVWPGVIKQHLLDLTPYTKGAEKTHFPSIVANNTVDGKLLAMPWFTDAGLLYYRKDLLEKYKEKVPTTWEELAVTAQKIQDGERKAGNSGMYGYVFQGKAYEGLTCNALEWVSSYKGGNIIDANGKITIDNAQAAKALDMAASWVGKIAPKGVLSFGEEEARGVFQNGNSVFMRNWPYAWALAQKSDSKVKDKVGVAALPKGGVDGQSAAALGGWQLAVSKYSKHPTEAADLVLYLTSRDVQKRRAIEASFNPTIVDLYKDPEVLKAAPFMGSLYDVFIHAVARPATVTGEKYNQVSAAFWNASYQTLSGQTKGADSVKKLSQDLSYFRRGDKW